MAQDAVHPVAPGGRSAVVSLALIAGLGLLLVAQTYMNRHFVPAQAKILFLLALAIVWAALGQRPIAVPQDSGPEPRRFPLARMAWFATPGAVLVIVSAAYAWRQKAATDGVFLWLLGLGLFLTSLVIYQIPARGEWRRIRLPLLSEMIGRSWPAVVLVTIMAFALYLRVFDIKNIPPFVHDDEAAYGLESRDLADGNLQAVFVNDWGWQPMMTALPGALVMKVWNDNLGALRLANALMGVASLPFLYLLARMFVGSPAALLAVFLLAVSKIDIHFSRQGMNNIQVVPLTVIAVYLLTRAVRRQSVGDAFVCGIAGGMALYSYFTGRIIPFIVGSVLLMMIVTHPRQWRTYLRLGFAVLVAALFIFGPMVGYYLGDMQRMLGYQNEKAWWNNMGHVTGGDPTITKTTVLARQIEHSFWGFNYYYDGSWQFGSQSPLLDTVTAILFFVGVAIALRYWRDPGYFALLAWFVLTPFFMGVLAVGPPNTLRLVALVPGQCVLAAIAVESIWNALKRHGRLPSLLTAVTAFALVPSIALYINYHEYFTVWAPSRVGEPLTEVARYLERNGKDVTPIMVGNDFSLDSRIVRFLAPGIGGYTTDTLESWLPLRVSIAKDVLFIAADQFAPALPIVRDYYPNGILEEHRSENNQLLFVTYRVPPEEIARLQGLTGRYRSSKTSGDAVGRNDSAIAFDWNSSRPPGIANDFVVEWDGSLFAPDYAPFRLRFEGDGDATLMLDGKQILRKQAGQQFAEATVTLAKGWHPLHIDHETNGAALRLAWQGPNSGMETIGRQYFSTLTTARGLLATYYNGAATDGTPIIQAIEPAIFGRVSAFTRQFGWMTRPYANTWVGTLQAPTGGTYGFGVRAYEGDVGVKLDGRTVIELGPTNQERKESQIALTAGPHRIEVTYICPQGRLFKQELWWAPPGSQMTPVPPSALSPGP